MRPAPSPGSTLRVSFAADRGRTDACVPPSHRLGFARVVERRSRCSSRQRWSIGTAFAGVPAASAAVSDPGECRSPQIPSGFRTAVATAVKVSRDPPRRLGSFAVPGEDRVLAGHGLRHGVRRRRAAASLARRVRDDAPGDEVRPRPGAGQRPGSVWSSTRAASSTAGTPASRRWRTPGSSSSWSRGCGGSGGSTDDPVTAWRQIERTKRFNSYPRPGTDDTPTRHPFSMCPVAGAVSYQDDFGERRTTGGYHPHSGNDVHWRRSAARSERRSPGWRSPHIDNWFAGRSVGLVGAEGFVRNAHLSRFGHLGYVNAGAVIGYVGHDRRRACRRTTISNGTRGTCRCRCTSPRPASRGSGMRSTRTRS